VATQYRTIEEEVGAEGGDQIKGPWQVSYIVEPAEGWFERRGGELRFREPAEGETHHLEIIPREASTGRVVPNVPVTLEVLDEQGERVDEKRLSPYYAEFFHYAATSRFPRPASTRFGLASRRRICVSTARSRRARRCPRASRSSSTASARAGVMVGGPRRVKGGALNAAPPHRPTETEVSGRPRRTFVHGSNLG
jgi:hypothetical protein